MQSRKYRVSSTKYGVENALDINSRILTRYSALQLDSIGSQMKKSPEEIKKQIIFYYLSGSALSLEEVNGKETFTIFDKVDKSTQNSILSQLSLKENELPVVVLFSKDSTILNTTERFIHITSKIEEIKYLDFAGHDGYKRTRVRNRWGKMVSIKNEGYFEEFDLKLRNGTTITWVVPSGHAGTLFWNVTKKCEFIGRKYLGVENAP